MQNILLVHLMKLHKKHVHKKFKREKNEILRACIVQPRTIDDLCDWNFIRNYNAGGYFSLLELVTQELSSKIFLFRTGYSENFVGPI